ncbi:hypothetical protein HMPREF9555_02028 [Selenomonas artemidis F0399]|uniref:Uncharacterized protein n=1 Tax=Selenomonas artemidis F0399 TaxID=749551 RepID=E7N4T3_9FIRM|nr:hypothetical protein HMPREF9555_02028 [Selenomonas artemidis F0399]
MPGQNMRPIPMLYFCDNNTAKHKIQVEAYASGVIGGTYDQKI